MEVVTNKDMLQYVMSKRVLDVNKIKMRLGGTNEQKCKSKM